MEIPLTLPISRIADEAKDVKTFYFRYRLNSRPGQFVNLWIPGVDEKPFSVSYQNDKEFAVTVQKLGGFTEKLFEMKKGSLAGIRGPYGNGYKIEGKNVLLVGGGCGCGPLAFLADEAVKRKIKVSFIMGARSRINLIFLERIKKIANTIAVTDDGSFGFKGFATSAMEEFLKNKKIDKVYSCGPEMMMKRVAEICSRNRIRCELSLERYMKCGFGVCGQCCVDKTGWRVCKEGPVFQLEQVKQMTEFGNYKRDATGKKVYFKK